MSAKNDEVLKAAGWRCWYKTKTLAFRADRWEDLETGELHAQPRAMEIQRLRTWARKRAEGKL